MEYRKNFQQVKREKINTQYPYATTKYLGEKLVLDWAKIYNMNNISLRFLMFTDQDLEPQELMAQFLVYF